MRPNSRGDSRMPSTKVRDRARIEVVRGKTRSGKVRQRVAQMSGNRCRFIDIIVDSRRRHDFVIKVR